MGLIEMLTKVKDRAENFLNEKNIVTDCLGKLEEKTGIKKKIIALGLYFHTSNWIYLTRLILYVLLNDVFVSHCCICLNFLQTLGRLLL